MTTSVVTGGNGYFGRLLVDRLLAAGDRVVVFVLDVTGVDARAGDRRVRVPAIQGARRRRWG